MVKNLSLLGSVVNSLSLSGALSGAVYSLSLFGGVLLAGCAAVGPDYRLPAAAAVNAPAAQGAFVAAPRQSSPDAPPDSWWQLFDDDQLNRLIAQAFAANTDLRAAEANLERSGGLLAEARTGRQVSGTVNAGTSWVQQSAESYLSHVEPPEKEVYDTGLAVAYDFDVVGRIRRGIEAAQADVQAAEAARDVVRVVVAAETTRAYAEICDAGGELASLHAVLDLQRRSLDLTRLLIQNGRAVEFEGDRQQELIDEIAAKVPTLEARRLNACYRLATLLGRPPEAYDPAWLKRDRALRLASRLPVGDGRELLRRRPDVRAAERHLAAMTARIGVATAGLYPDIKLGVTVGSTGATKDAFTGLTNRFGVGPSITWNLNPNAARARVAQSEALTRQALASFDGTVLKALRDVELALDTYDHGLDRLSLLQSARDRAAKVADTTERLRQGGRVSALVALDAQRTLALAEQALAAEQSQTSENQIAVFIALGGGWQIGKTAAAVPAAHG